MTTPEDDIALRRILVALDVSEQSRAALESAARLAAALKAELVGLFVEDVELLQLADLPVARLIGPRGTAVLDAATMRRALKVQADEARRTLAHAAEHWKVNWSFRVTQGICAEAVLTEARQFDLVALGRTSRPQTRTSALGTTARLAAVTASCSVLVSRATAVPGGPVVVLFEGGTRALPLASELAHIFAARLEVCAIASDDEAAAKCVQKARNWLVEHRAGGQLHSLSRPDASAIKALVDDRRAGLLVIDARGPMVAKLDLSGLLEKLELPVLVLR